MRKILLVVICCLTALWSWATPARRDARKVKQADGTVMTVYAHGDEHFSWLTNAAGEWIEKNAEGNYVVMDANRKKEAQSRMREAQLAPQAVQTPTPLNVLPRGLVVLAEFQDVHFSTPKETMDSMLNAENFYREYTYIYPGTTNEYTIKANGSVRKYFEASSHGAYSPKFDVIGPLRVGKNMKYYGENPSANSRDKNIKDFVTELCEQLVALSKSNKIDLTQYDADDDGFIDYLGIIYAGYGEADGGGENTIWPHKYEVTYYKTITEQGKTFRIYNCNPEMNAYTQHYMGIGTFCHEFGHVLGLPDIYSTDGNTVHKTCGEWDIMDYGCYVNEGDTPPGYTGYERFFFDWAKPRLLKEAENVTLNPLMESNEVLMITATGNSNMKGNDPDPNVFYILDNRQQTGFDSHIPGHGMLLTKINYVYGTWFGNSVNKVANDLHIDLIEADGWAPEFDGETRTWFGKPGDAFPAGAKEYKGIKDYPLTDITETDGIITFRVKGGVPTGCDEVETVAAGVRKELRDGRMVIVKDGRVMTPTGMTVR
ncbi:MAG: M6 family metalloprotease domain-containing protein [Paludibacteraceae bacterium]|nr:M6 family metalloprotease domain-containing protein [Paludibacteraceae bacterium]